MKGNLNFSVDVTEPTSHQVVAPPCTKKPIVGDSLVCRVSAVTVEEPWLYP